MENDLEKPTQFLKIIINGKLRNINICVLSCLCNYFICQYNFISLYNVYNDINIINTYTIKAG